MANPEHLEILRQGVKMWNRWRKDNPEVIPDLREAFLLNADLSKADLSKADLSKADLSRADLSRADLGKAKLFGADLSGADLSGANLRDADFSEANLSFADLSGADLREADLRGANLSWANLSWANLSWANLGGADLSWANLSGADLSWADLYDAKLQCAKCYKANLSEAELYVAQLINTNLDGATLTGAKLWETQRAGWSIKGVICKYVYWGEPQFHKKGKEKIVYSPSEFEKLFADKPKVRLFYKDGISMLEIATLPALIAYLEDSHPGSGLRLVGIREDTGGVVVELAIENDDDKSPEQLGQCKIEIEITAQRAIEAERRFLAEEKQRLRLEGELKQLTSVVDKLILRPTINVQGDIMRDTYNVSGQVGAVGKKARASKMTFKQIVNHFEHSVDLSELAKQLEELRQAITKKQDSSPQAADALIQIDKAKIAAQERNPSKVVKRLKAAGEWTLDFANEIGKDVVVAAIKTSMGMQ